jgi:hypothetical protein
VCVCVCVRVGVLDGFCVHVVSSSFSFLKNAVSVVRFFDETRSEFIQLLNATSLESKGQYVQCVLSKEEREREKREVPVGPSDRRDYDEFLFSHSNTSQNPSTHVHPHIGFLSYHSLGRRSTSDIPRHRI